MRSRGSVGGASPLGQKGADEVQDVGVVRDGGNIWEAAPKIPL